MCQPKLLARNIVLQELVTHSTRRTHLWQQQQGIGKLSEGLTIFALKGGNLI